MNRATTPVSVYNLTGVVDVACGQGHACAVRSDNDVWCWGDNWAGQVDRDAGVLFRNQPVQVTFPN